MTRTRVAICCIASPDEARMAVAAGADAPGLRPYALDRCSGVRTHGRLDPEKPAAFMRAVRRAHADTNRAD